jgi:hypothetical protein
LEMDEMIPRVSTMSNVALRAFVERTVHIYIYPASGMCYEIWF